MTQGSRRHHFSHNRLDGTYNFVGFSRIKRIGMRRGKLTSIVVEILAGSGREFIGQGRTSEYLRAYTEIAASHSMGLLHHLAAKH